MISLLNKLRQDHLLVTQHYPNTRLTRSQLALRINRDDLSHRDWLTSHRSYYLAQMYEHHGLAINALRCGSVEQARFNLGRHTYYKMATIIMEEMVHDELAR
jgi:hypothetical protein